MGTETLVDKIASTIFESEYAMRWTQAISNSAMSAIVERHRRNARLSIEATAQYLEALETYSDEDMAASEWVAGFLRDAALVRADAELKNTPTASVV